MLGIVGALYASAPAGAQPRGEPDFTIVGDAFVAIVTEDVDAAARWYASALELTEVKRVEADDGAYSIRIMTRGGLTVELLSLPGTQAPPERHLGLFKSGFYVSDIDAAHESLRTRQVDVDERVFTDEPLSVRTFVFRDPDGNRLQVFERCRGPCE